MNTPTSPSPQSVLALGMRALSDVWMRWRSVAALALCGVSVGIAQAGVNLPDQPVFTNTGVPGNLALALSVEFPTAVSVAHIGSTYDAAKQYLGYFDPDKCYNYIYVADETQRHFAPRGNTNGHRCTGNKWSGNFLNWATMQTIDPFRWALTGGYRSTDTNTLTLLEKAWHSGQGGTGNFPNRSMNDSNDIKDSTALEWSSLIFRIHGLGNKMRFTRNGNLASAAAPTVYDPAVAVDQDVVYELSVRVKVCDTSAGAGTLEANCTAYPSGAHKPTGLLQQYADKIRYSAFGYLNDDSILRDGGVLRARQKFVGPLAPTTSSTSTVNAASEWDSNTGVMNVNPDSTDASATATLLGVPVSNSGVLNYLNKFGEVTPGSYKTYDPVGELYYAAVRYFKNLGNVPEWTNMATLGVAEKTKQVDGFPVITEWDDPIQYACQRNFILGIGDVNTHADKNVPGATGSGNEPTKPPAVVADTTVDTVVASNKVGQLHGLGASLGTTYPYNGCCNNNSALMAGLAYDSHTKDIRPDNGAKPQTKGLQTISTYWLDILEYQTYKANNQFYLAAKYGGFKVPEGYDPYAQSTDIPKDWWSTSGENTASGQPRPDNYFVASQPDQMVAGLKRAFASIAAQLRSFSTSFSISSPQVSTSGTNSYSAQYDSTTWTGEVTSNAVTFDAQNNPMLTPNWAFSNKLAAQIASDNGMGWDTKRRIATFNTSSNTGVAFRLGNLSSAQQSALDTVYRSGNDSADFLNYLRGDPTNEENSTAASSSKAYRNRARSVGDIVGSRLRVLGAPTSPFSSAANPGYSEFKNRAGIANRATVVYVGSNDGMLHAINASSDASVAGTELFAYVPGAIYQGPDGTPQVNGLQTRGDPDFTHFNFVDGTPAAFDIDFGRTVGGSGTNWRTILVGSMGKGGKRYFAIDVTDPSLMTTEAAVASKVLWEFSHPMLGYTFAEPLAVKTLKYGWVLVFGSGYNNSDGKGYIFLVNPRTGDLLEPPLATGAGTNADEAGLSAVQAYVPDRTDNTAETLYAGDLLGNLWRVDVTGTSGNYPTPTLFAQLTNKSGQALPVTSRPLVVIQPFTNRRWVVVGTGRLLSNSDKGSGQAQGFFAFMDGNLLRTNSAAQLPGGMSFPLQRGNLRELTDLTTKVTLDLATEIGWWYDLGNAAGLGWRVISDPSSFYGEVSFSAMLPSLADPCSPSGLGRIYTIDLGTGKTKLVDASGNPISYFDGFTGSVTDLRNMSVNGKRRLFYGTDNGGFGPVNAAPSSPQAPRRLNWRELQLAD